MFFSQLYEFIMKYKKNKYFLTNLIFFNEQPENKKTFFIVYG